MAEDQKEKAHCLVVPAAIQGHFTPLLQFAKRLIPKRIRVTLALTRFLLNTITVTAQSGIHIDTISDGFDHCGFKLAKDPDYYFDTLRRVGSETLTDLIRKQSELGHPVHCLIYDASMPWFLDVAKGFGVLGAAFLTQSCGVDAIFYHIREGTIKPPVVSDPKTLVIDGLPPMELSDLPLLNWDDLYRGFFAAHLRQFSNDNADWVFCNTVDLLEKEAVDWLSKQWSINFRTIGPTIPSFYLDKQISDDKDYDISIFNPENQTCMNWLQSKPDGSVVYVSFGSLAVLSPQQTEELCFGLMKSNYYFLWVVRESEVTKLPKEYLSGEKGLIVSWCSQLQVLASGKVGCFFTHCGWNSTLEALSLGVPMVAMPNCGDQVTNAKFIKDVWKTGVRVEADDDEKGLIKREVIERCIGQVMEGEEMRRNAEKWEKIIKEAVLEGGSSHKNTNDFAASLIHFAETPLS
ncbi:Flavonol 7-O-beta-glucosyltransferase UGT74F1 [Linum grandiflorum]